VIDLCSMKKGEEQETYELIVRVFHKYVAPVYSKNGVEKFLGMLSPDGLSEMNNGRNSFVIVAKDQSKIMGMLLSEQHETLCSKLRGFYQYFGVRSNFIVIEVVYEYAQKAWRHWLGRRHRDGYISHKKFNNMLVRYSLPRLRIVHNA
jgi:hypothetical protein